MEEHNCIMKFFKWQHNWFLTLDCNLWLFHASLFPEKVLLMRKARAVSVKYNCFLHVWWKEMLGLCCLESCDRINLSLEKSEEAWYREEQWWIYSSVWKGIIFIGVKFVSCQLLQIIFEKLVLAFIIICLPRCQEKFCMISLHYNNLLSINLLSDWWGSRKCISINMWYF